MKLKYLIFLIVFAQSALAQNPSAPPEEPENDLQNHEQCASQMSAAQVLGLEPPPVLRRVLDCRPNNQVDDSTRRLERPVLERGLAFIVPRLFTN